MRAMFLPVLSVTLLASKAETTEKEPKASRQWEEAGKVPEPGGWGARLRMGAW